MKRRANREAKNALDCDKLKFLSPSEVFIIVFKNGQVTSKEDVVELQERFETNDIEKILLSLLKGVNEND